MSTRLDSGGPYSTSTLSTIHRLLEYNPGSRAGVVGIYLREWRSFLSTFLVVALVSLLSRYEETFEVASSSLHSSLSLPPFACDLDTAQTGYPSKGCGLFLSVCPATCRPSLCPWGLPLICRILSMQLLYSPTVDSVYLRLLGKQR